MLICRLEDDDIDVWLQQVGYICSSFKIPDGSTGASLPISVKYGQAISYGETIYLAKPSDLQTDPGNVVKLAKNQNSWEVVDTIGMFADRAIFPAPVVTQNMIEC